MERNFQHITDKLRAEKPFLNEAGASGQSKEQILAVLKYGHTLKNQNIERQKSNKQTFIILGVAFTAAACITCLAMLGVHLPWWAKIISIKGAWGLFAALFFTLRAVRFEPKSELTQRMARMRFRK